MFRIKFLSLLALSCLGLLIGSAYAGEEKIKVMVVTGGHDFEPQFFELFKGYGDIEYTSLVQPKANEAFADGTAKDYDVVVLYDMWDKITDEQKQGYLDYLNSGKGLVALHHCLASYQNWPEFVDIIGGTYIIDPKGREFEGKKYEPGTYLHDVDFKVQVANPDHPITKGVKDFDIHDETYKGFYVSPKAEILLKTDHPTSGPNIAWVMPHPQAKITYIQLGHDSKAYQNPNYRKLIEQAIRWAAGK